jgi:hypothetical protein
MPGLLPRWDLAAHLLNGWTTYDHAVHGRVIRFLWDIWSQGYWPPGQSMFQVPFYPAASGNISGGRRLAADDPSRAYSTHRDHSVQRIMITPSTHRDHSDHDHVIGAQRR